MILKDFIKEVHLEVCNDVELSNDVNDIYIGDLLSFVMANGQEGALWLTVQKHVNVVAVASLLDFAGIVFVEGVEPDAQTIEKATQENIPLLKSPLSSYELVKEIIHVL
ncbi:MAG: hypothetical protein LUG46_03390 [Erysipelotrichaceae bacterium]|nr:hypothetical protein [Erysipelotrichaceae bacterium]